MSCSHLHIILWSMVVHRIASYWTSIDEQIDFIDKRMRIFNELLPEHHVDIHDMNFLCWKYSLPSWILLVIRIFSNSKGNYQNIPIMHIHILQSGQKIDALLNKIFMIQNPHHDSRMSVLYYEIMNAFII